VRLRRPGDHRRGRAGQGAAHRAGRAGHRGADPARAKPGAWIVDFTNPVGIVTRALLDAGHRAVGLCNVAIGFQRRFAALLGVAPGEVSWTTSASTT
jgi:6-phospho-beta-glucosidase